MNARDELKWIEYYQQDSQAWIERAYGYDICKERKQEIEDIIASECPEMSTLQKEEMLWHLRKTYFKSGDDAMAYAQCIIEAKVFTADRHLNNQIRKLKKE